MREIADIIVQALGFKNVEYTYKLGTPDSQGWPGDVKLMLLDITRITRETVGSRGSQAGRQQKRQPSN